ncbi:hypothetical protein FN846DRAFT_930793 [Sphaerosporella brunnea]|uniref:Uncharacterized protein n=1 Tax=Sphaerosporella brunnea TaxID=1250544 RepID=A0A5J5F7X8_9PEZI|nr:hypothetical protein FN846DRAFT_930793 [Sphaerosporella brunnea]
MRQVFTYSDFVDDTAQRCEDILCLDEEQQEELIRQLRREDIHRNEFYCKAIMVLTLLPIMFFAIRYYYMTSNGWLFNADLFSAASLLISYKSVPTVILGFRDAPADMLRTEDYVSLRSPGSFWLKMQRMNIVISAIMCMWTWMRHSWAIGEKPLYSEDYLCALPFIMAVIVYLMRKAMEAVNFGELEHLRYEFRGA